MDVDIEMPKPQVKKPEAAKKSTFKTQAP